MNCYLSKDLTKPSIVNPAIEEVCTDLISSIQDYYIRITWVISFHQETKEIQQTFYITFILCFSFY